MTGFTPGPWHTIEGAPYLNGEFHWTVTAPHSEVATITTPSRHAEADARLIAAAPELLAVLVIAIEELRIWVDSARYDSSGDMGVRIGDDIIERATTLIAKATAPPPGNG